MGSGKVGQMLRVKKAPVGEWEWCFGSEGETIKRREHGGGGAPGVLCLPHLTCSGTRSALAERAPTFLRTESGSRQTCPSQQQHDSLADRKLWGNERIHLLDFSESVFRNYPLWCHKRHRYPDPWPLSELSVGFTNWLCVKIVAVSVFRKVGQHKSTKKKTKIWRV